jgi:hypothetical protein
MWFALLFLASPPELLGQQALLTEACLPWFTEPPRIYVAEPKGDFDALLVGVDVRTVPLRVEPKSPGALMRMPADTPLPRGIGQVVLRRDGVEVARWPVLWDADLGRVDEAIARARQAPHDQRAAAWEAVALQVWGVPSAAARALRAAAYHRLTARDFGAALALLGGARSVEAACGHTAGVALADKYEGMVRHLIGDHLTAERMLTSARAALERLAAPEAGAVTQDLAAVLVELGRVAEGLALLAPLEAALSKGRPRAEWLLNLAWARHAAGEDSRAQLEQVLTEAPDHPDLVANAQAHLARLDLDAGRLDAAGHRLEVLASIPPTASGLLAGFTHLLGADLAAARGDRVGAWAALARAITLAEATDDPELAWRARHARGRLALGQGNLAGAEADFVAARADLLRGAARTALTTSRAPFLASRAALARDLGALWLRLDRPAEAILLADAEQSHVLAALAEAAQVDRLSAPEQLARATAIGRYQSARQVLEARASERELVHPDGLVAFDVETRRQAEAAARLLEDSLGTRPPPAGADLAAVQARLDAGESIVFSLQDQDFHLDAQGLHPGWPAAGHLYLTSKHPPPERLVGRSWSHLPHMGLLRAKPSIQGQRAVILADPTHDLPATRREGQQVAAVLGGALLTGDAATRAAIQEALASAGHVHFAGHGALVAESPWQAHLRLADGRLTLADVLASPLRVSRVVLSGCETGRAGALSSAEHIGLPEALLAAGARSVVAAVEKVDDTATAAFMEAFYAAGGAERPGPALVAARAAVGGAVGAAFQLWGRP